MRLLPALLLLLPVLTAACGDSSPTKPDPKENTGPVSGTVGGVAWTNTISATATYTPATKTYTFHAADGSLTGRAVLLMLTDVDGPGTFTLGVDLPFRYANVALQAGVWETNVGGGGQAVISIATTSRLKGTMTWTGVPAGSSPGATGTVAVNMSFDVPVTVLSTD